MGGGGESTQLEPVNKYYKNKLLYLLSPQSLTKILHLHLNTHYICWRFVSKPPRHKSPVYHIQTLHLTMQESQYHHARPSFSDNLSKYLHNFTVCVTFCYSTSAAKTNTRFSAFIPIHPS